MYEWLYPFDHGDQINLTLTGKIVTWMLLCPFGSWRSSQPYPYWRSNKMLVCNWDDFVCSEREICNKDFKVLGFLKEFDIPTVLWQGFFSLFLFSFFSSWFVWQEGDYIVEIRVKKMGFECAIGPPIFTWIRHFPS